MPSVESQKRLMESQLDRLSPAETYAISVISRTPTQEGKERVFREFATEVFGGDRASSDRVGERFGLSVDASVAPAATATGDE